MSTHINANKRSVWTEAATCFAEELDAMPENWPAILTDVSWRNDAAPSAMLDAFGDHPWFRLWVVVPGSDLADEGQTHIRYFTGNDETQEYIWFDNLADAVASIAYDADVRGAHKEFAELAQWIEMNK